MRTDTKFFYNRWRPVTAIRAGDTDSNPETELILIGSVSRRPVDFAPRDGRGLHAVCVGPIHLNRKVLLIIDERLIDERLLPTKQEAGTGSPEPNPIVCKGRNTMKTSRAERRSQLSRFDWVTVPLIFILTGAARAEARRQREVAAASLLGECFSLNVLSG